MRHQRIDLLTARLFLAAGHLGSLTKAADALHLVPSAVSRRLTELEKEVGVPLFVRKANGVTLTPAGLEAQRQFARLLASHERVLTALKELSGSVRGVIRVWATSTSLTDDFAMGLKCFLDKNEGIRADVEERTDLDVVKAVEGGKADVGFCSSHQASTDLQRRDFGGDKVVIVAPFGHPLLKHKNIQFSDIVPYDIVGWDEGIALGSMVQSLAAASGVALRVRVQVRSLGALCGMVKSGLGIALAPSPRVLGEAAIFDLRTVPVHEAWADRKISMIFGQSVSLVPSAQMFVDFMSRLAPKSN